MAVRPHVWVDSFSGNGQRQQDAEQKDPVPRADIEQSAVPLCDGLDASKAKSVLVGVRLGRNGQAVLADDLMVVVVLNLDQHHAVLLPHGHADDALFRVFDASAALDGVVQRIAKERIQVDRGHKAQQRR